jgi:hypothetical protein
MAVALCLVLNGALPCLAYAQQGGQWVQQGPLGAPVNTVVVHPTNPSIVYIGLDLRGVYRSDNGATAGPRSTTGSPT